VRRPPGTAGERRSGRLLTHAAPQSLADWLQLLERRHPKTIDLGLDRCGEVWRRLGSPRPARNVITVAGTNGKGSTVATACALLDALGYRQGAYTSPHILRFNERIRARGRDIEDSELVSAFEEVEVARRETSLTYFEFTTLAALLWLSRQRLDFAMLEVGLGGRLDAVNLVDANCAVITPIALDHQEYLGDDREQIGREKAGIMRRGQPVVVSDRLPPQSVLEHAAGLDCPLWLLGRDFDVTEVSGLMRVNIGSEALDLPCPALPGAHQLDNAAAALAAIVRLLPGILERGSELIDSLSRGLGSVQISGRMQKVSEAPPTWVDVGHNPAAAAALRRAMESGPAWHIVLGMLRDKDAAAVAREMAPLRPRWYCAGLPGERGQSGAKLAQRITPWAEAGRVEVFNDVGSALAAARNCRDCAILVMGSFVTAAEAMLHLGDADRIPLGQGEKDNN
jgi:dihydrofolate synthase/folylpolyglutamate synthase